MELGFNPFLEDLTDQTSQNDLLANNCQKKIDPARPVEPGTLRVFNWGYMCGLFNWDLSTLWP